MQLLLFLLFVPFVLLIHFRNQEWLKSGYRHYYRGSPPLFTALFSTTVGIYLAQLGIKDLFIYFQVHPFIVISLVGLAIGNGMLIFILQKKIESFEKQHWKDLAKYIYKTGTSYPGYGLRFTYFKWVKSQHPDMHTIYLQNRWALILAYTGIPVLGFLLRYLF